MFKRKSRHRPKKKGNERVRGQTHLTKDLQQKENGYIGTVKHFTSLVVNAANLAFTCVDVDVMEKKGQGECLRIVLSNHFIEIVGADFVAWT